MKNKNLFLKCVISSILAVNSSQAQSHGVQSMDMEKCYGIVKAGMNDCETSKTACVGSATQDAQPDAYILLPKGTCVKIIGGSLKSHLPKK